jgi:hypothetical protein
VLVVVVDDVVGMSELPSFNVDTYIIVVVVLVTFCECPYVQLSIQAFY